MKSEGADLHKAIEMARVSSRQSISNCRCEVWLLFREPCDKAFIRIDSQTRLIGEKVETKGGLTVRQPDAQSL